MGKYELEEKIENSHLLVTSQKEAVISMVRGEIKNDDISMEEVIDECLWKLFEIRISSLTDAEQREITTVIKEMGYDNS